MSQQLQDAKKARLELMTNETGQVNDLEVLWLLSEILGTGAESYNDLWDLFLVMQGFDTGTVQDRQMEWMESLGFDAPQANDRWMQFWSSPYEEPTP